MAKTIWMLAKHWREAAQEYHKARRRNPLMVSPSGKPPAYRAALPISQGGWVPSAEELHYEYRAALERGKQENVGRSS